MERLDPLTDNSGREGWVGVQCPAASAICASKPNLFVFPGGCEIHTGMLPKRWEPEEVIEPGFHRLDGGEVDKARGLQ